MLHAMQLEFWCNRIGGGGCHTTDEAAPPRFPGNGPWELEPQGAGTVAH